MSGRMPTLSEVNNIKRQICHLNIGILRTILQSTGLCCTGRKQDLQSRIVYYLDHNPSPEIVHHILNITSSSQVPEMNTARMYNGVTPNNGHHQAATSIPNMLQVPNTNTPALRGNAAVPNMVARGGPQHQLWSVNSPLTKANVDSNCYIRLPTANGPVSLPLYPKIGLMDSPFYETLSVLLPPQFLLPQEGEFSVNRPRYERTVLFSLSADQAESIAYHRKFQKQHRMEFGVQVLIRFCRFETPYQYTGPMNDSLPINLMLTLNEKQVALPEKLPSNKPELSGRRPPKPINLTHEVRISPIIANQIRVIWQHDFNNFAYYAYTVLLVKKRSPSELSQFLVTEKMTSVQRSKAMIREKMRLDESDDDIQMATSLPTSLLCPLGKCRMSVPLRAEQCSHLQCFDAHLFLSMNERKPTWKCPFCDGPALFKDLYVDGLFNNILATPSSLELEEIILLDDGTWQAASTNSGSEETEIPESPVVISRSSQHSNHGALASTSNGGAANGGGESSEFVDLCSSDDDDEVDNSVNARPAPVSTNLNDTVITLSDDSEDESSSTTPSQIPNNSGKRSSTINHLNDSKRPCTSSSSSSNYHSSTPPLPSKPGSSNTAGLPTLTGASSSRLGQFPQQPATTLPSRTSSVSSQGGIRMGQLPQQPATAIDFTNSNHSGYNRSNTQSTKATAPRTQQH